MQRSWTFAEAKRCALILRKHAVAHLTVDTQRLMSLRDIHHWNTRPQLSDVPEQHSVAEGIVQ